MVLDQTKSCKLVMITGETKGLRALRIWGGDEEDDGNHEMVY